MESGENINNAELKERVPIFYLIMFFFVLH